MQKDLEIIELEKNDNGSFEINNNITCKKNLRDVELFLKELQNEKAMLRVKVRVTGPYREESKLDDLIDAIKVLRKYIKKELK